jgi:hypothetical protein
MSENICLSLNEKIKCIEESEIGIALAIALMNLNVIKHKFITKLKIKKSS